MSMELNEFQTKFLQAMEGIQNDSVQIALSHYKDGDDIEDLLYDTTFNVIVDIMTFIDGYSFGYEKLDVINRESGVRLKENPFIELHDTICDFIMYDKNGSHY